VHSTVVCSNMVSKSCGLADAAGEPVADSLLATALAKAGES
jgi:hypothetical protein